MTKKSTIARDYYLNGYALLRMDKESQTMKKFQSILNDLLFGKMQKPGFSWEVQGLSETLRPNVYEYDDVFLDVLFDHGLHEQLSLAAEKNLYLGHIQIVKTKPGPSYVDWHRDTHFYDGEAVSGNIPPVHKIIFYPQATNAAPEPRLKVLRGSNRTMFSQKDLDFTLINCLPTDVVTSTPNEAILFETTTFHAVIPDALAQGSIRAIYSFMTRAQLEENYLHKPVHAELVRRYEARLGCCTPTKIVTTNEQPTATTTTTQPGTSLQLMFN